MSRAEYILARKSDVWYFIALLIALVINLIIFFAGTIPRLRQPAVVRQRHAHQHHRVRRVAPVPLGRAVVGSRRAQSGIWPGAAGPARAGGPHPHAAALPVLDHDVHRLAGGARSRAHRPLEGPWLLPASGCHGEVAVFQVRQTMCRWQLQWLCSVVQCGIGFLLERLAMCAVFFFAVLSRRCGDGSAGAVVH